VSGGSCPGAPRIESTWIGRINAAKGSDQSAWPVVILKQHCRCRDCGRLFSPQDRDWFVAGRSPADASTAACRLGREVATQQSFDRRRVPLSCDWTLDGPLHSEEVRRLGEALGSQRWPSGDAEVREYNQLGQRPACRPMRCRAGSGNGRGTLSKHGERP